MTGTSRVTADEDQAPPNGRSGQLSFDVRFTAHNLEPPKPREDNMSTPRDTANENCNEDDNTRAYGLKDKTVLSSDTNCDDDETGSDDDKDSDDVSSKMETVAPPDGGWGWMVTLAGFVMAFLFHGLVGSFGLVMPALMETFESSVSVTSLGLSVFVATNLLSGPLAAYLVKHTGYRSVAFIGGLLCSVGLTCSAYAPNIEMFIFLCGGIAGTGMGLVYLPIMTVSNLYFEKKRGVVAGVITSGAGVGLLVLAQMTEVLLEEYGWRGCFLITGGLMLNLCVCAGLLRPLPQVPVSRAQPTDDSLDDDYTVQGQKALSRGDLKGSGEFQSDYHTQLGNLVKNATTGLSLVSVETIPNTDVEDCKRRGSESPSVWSSVKNLFVDPHAVGSHTHIGDRPRHKHLTRGNSVSVHHIPNLDRNAPSRGFSTWLLAELPPSLSHHSVDKMASHGNVSHDQKYSLSGHAPHLQGHHHERKRAFGSEQKIGQFLTPSLPRRHLPRVASPLSASAHALADEGEGALSEYQHRNAELQERLLTFGLRRHSRYRPMSNSVHSLVHQHTKPLLGNSSHSSSPLPTVVISVPDDGDKKKADAGDLEKKFPEKDSTLQDACADTSLLSSSPSASTVSTESSCPDCEKAQCGFLEFMWWHRLFSVFLAGAFLVQLVCSVPALFTPAYAYGQDVGKEEVAQILSIFGVLNTVGRLGSGLLVFWGCDSLRVHNLGLLLGGATCLLYPLCTSFPTITACLALHGLFMGAFPPLQAVILVEFLGIERLTSCFGILGFVKALASLTGAPLAGAVYGLSGLYSVPVAAAGAILVMAAVTHQLMVCFSEPTDRDGVSDTSSNC